MTTLPSSPQAVWPLQASLLAGDGEPPRPARRRAKKGSSDTAGKGSAAEGKELDRFIKTVAPDGGYLRKPVEAILVTPKEGKLTLQARRFHNVLLRHAQASPLPAPGERFQMPLSQFVQNTRLEQVNNAYLAEVLRMLMTTTVEWGDASAKLSGPEYKWSAATLISHATIQKRVGEVPVLLYDFDPDLRQKMLRPEFYAKVALDVGPKMSTHAAHVLYELGQRYFNDGKGFQSQALPWRQWVVPLTGNADRQVEGLEYKTFMRDVLKPALRDVNDPNVPQIPFTIAIHEQRLGRRVEFIRFIVQPKRQGRSAKLGTKDGLEMPTEDLTLIARAIHLGISQHEAEGIYEKYGPRMGAGLEAMERRKLSEPIANPANYLRKVIVAQPPSREDVLDVEVKAIGKPLQTADTTTKNNLAVLRKRHEESLLNDAEALLNESTAQMRRAEYECFERDVLEDLKTPLQRAWREFRRKDVSSEAKLPMFLRDTFLRWYIRDKGWKALDSDDLLHWGAQRGLVEFRTA